MHNLLYNTYLYDNSIIFMILSINLIVLFLFIIIYNNFLIN